MKPWHMAVFFAFAFGLMGGAGAYDTHNNYTLPLTVYGCSALVSVVMQIFLDVAQSREDKTLAELKKAAGLAGPAGIQVIERLRKTAERVTR